MLHPWAYDLDKVDFKYIMNNDISGKICSSLQTQNAQVFWLTFFNSQAAVSADDFFNALREVAALNKIPSFYEANIPQYQEAAREKEYMMSLAEHGQDISLFVQNVVDAGLSQGYNALRDQTKTYQTEFRMEGIVEGLGLPAGFSPDPSPKFAQLTVDPELNALRLRELSPAEKEVKIDLQRRIFDSIPDEPASHKLNLRFEAVDTDELRNLEITVDGTTGVYKIGEGESNHYQIPNDKKLWESQLMIVCKNGQYYIRDLGVVHTSRIKVDMKTKIQIQQDTLIDLGKVVHYHFDKATHHERPSVTPSQSFLIMRPDSEDYRIEDEEEGNRDPAALRARPTWVSNDENKEGVQKEVYLEADKRSTFSVGRSNRREINIRLKAVSADHCRITYTNSEGWYISEDGKDKLSSNGTFVFMKSQKQMTDHEPSSLIPLYDGMVISFINYEIRVTFDKKD